MEKTSRRVIIRVTGIVQGVFFRAETRNEARALGLHGYVRNRPDSSVEIVAEGTADAVADLITWCGQGPPLARVDKVEVSEQTPTGALSGFQITF